LYLYICQSICYIAVITMYNSFILSNLAYMCTLADPGGGAHPARAPANGRGPMMFYAQNAKFSSFFLRLLRSRFILSIILKEICQKHAKKMNFYFNRQYFQLYT